MKSKLGIAALAASGLLLVACGGGGGTADGGGDGGCTPQAAATWCAAQGKNCGTIVDSCGTNVVFCGGCSSPLTCGGGGVPNVCGTPGGTTDGGSTTDGGAGTDGGTSDGGTTVTQGLGSACTTDAQCATVGGVSQFCIYGICTAPCAGAASNVPNCNADAIADRSGPAGGSYSCWPLGTGLISLCWPNGSGAACTGANGSSCSGVSGSRSGEICYSGRCQYPSAPAGSQPRTNGRCNSDSECQTGEGCVIFGNLDDNNIRSEGACLWAGSRKSPGQTCTNDEECASFFCNQSCIGLCKTDTDCLAGTKCIAIGLGVSQFEEFVGEYLGVCVPWAGSKTPCTGNAACSSGETCSAFQDLINNDLDVGLMGACETLPNPGAAGDVGASCTADAQCKAGNCLTNPLTGLGYCTNFCFDAVDCVGGTSCRKVLFDTRDPSKASDDLRVGFCVQTDPGATCFVDVGCKVCSTDNDCNPAQGVTCIREVAGAPTGICRDGFGRCADPCRTCTTGGSDCPTGSTCASEQVGQFQFVNYCQIPTTGECVRADIEQVLVYEDGMCGDEQFPLDGGAAIAQNDLCFYHGRQTIGVPPNTEVVDIFACGTECAADGGACAPIPDASDGGIPTSCRTVYEFGIPTDGGTVGGAARSPTQCAPINSFQP